MPVDSKTCADASGAGPPHRRRAPRAAGPARRTRDSAEPRFDVRGLFFCPEQRHVGGQLAVSRLGASPAGPVVPGEAASTPRRRPGRPSQRRAYGAHRA